MEWMKSESLEDVFGARREGFGARLTQHLFGRLQTRMDFGNSVPLTGLRQQRFLAEPRLLQQIRKLRR